MEIARLVKKVVEKEFSNKKDIKIVKTKTEDNRSYHINSDKIKNLLGFVPKKSVEMAIRDLCEAFKKDLIPNSFESDSYFNVKKLKNN